MFYTIYRTTNLINGKFYIGKHKTKDLNDGYFGSGKYLIYAVNKYGIENFVTEVIEIFETEREVNLAEKILVVLDPEISYNLCKGGMGGFSFINGAGLTRKFTKDDLKKAQENRRKIPKPTGKKLIEIKKKLSLIVRAFNASEKGQALIQAKRLTTHININSKKANITRVATFKKIEHSKGIKNSQSGTMWITNRKVNKKFKGTVIPEGWEKGRVFL